MDSKTEITLCAASEIGAKYDASCKALFNNREIIAPVLKEVVPEYRDCTYEEIVGYINPESMTDAPVDDLSVAIGGTQTEMSSVSDKLIRYDTRFRAINPKLSTSELHFYLHIDLEVQNDYKPSNPSYPIIKRAIYYGVREISAQLGPLTEETNYDAIQKAYSIWICNDKIPDDLKNTVTRYTLTRQDVIGHCDEPEADYDLLEIVIVRRGDNEGKETIFDFLTGVFSGNLKSIKKYLGETENSQKIEAEVKTMSGLWQSVATEHLNKGISIGRNEGISIGRNEGISIGRNEGISIGRNEGISIGEKKGRQEGQNDLLMQLIANGEITEAQAAKYQRAN